MLTMDSTSTISTSCTHLIHYGVTCDGCGIRNIKGIRYKCSTCSDYDLCDTCEKSGRHSPDHVLYKIKVPEKNCVPIARPQTSQPIHEGVQCDGCGIHDIRGIRYKCSVCSNYDLCESCEQQPEIHPVSHPLCKIKSPRKCSEHQTALNPLMLILSMFQHMSSEQIPSRYLSARPMPARYLLARQESVVHLPALFQFQRQLSSLFAYRSNT